MKEEGRKRPKGYPWQKKITLVSQLLGGIQFSTDPVHPPVCWMKSCAGHFWQSRAKALPGLPPPSKSSNLWTWRVTENSAEGCREKRKGIPKNPTAPKLGDLVQNKLLTEGQVTQLPMAGVTWDMRNEGFNLGCRTLPGTALTCPVPAPTSFPQVQQIPSIDSGARGFYCVWVSKNPNDSLPN